jgi:hypothetical protein
VRKYADSAFATGPPPTPSSTLIDPVATTMTVDPSTGDVYVDEGNRISVFDSSGAHLYDFGSGDFAANSAGVAVKAGGNAYVGDIHSGGEEIDVYGPFSPSTNPPGATTNPATNIKKGQAILNGHLTPGEDPAVTDCYFEWGTSAPAYGNTIPCDEGDSFSGPADVSTLLTGLSPSMTYHYRLHVATTSSGDFTGADQTFTTQPVVPVRRFITSFGPDGTGASTFPATEKDLAFAHHDLFATVRGIPGQVYGFDASAPPAYSLIDGFDPLTPSAGVQNPGAIALDDTALASAGNVYFIASTGPSIFDAKIYGVDASGAPLPNFPIDPTVTPGPPTVNPAKGLASMAVDSAGNLWVTSHWSNRVLAYSPTGTFQGSVNLAGTAADGPNAIALNSIDDMYVAGSGGLAKFTAASGYSAGSSTVIASQRYEDLAINRASNHVFGTKTRSFAGAVDRVDELDSAGTLLRTFGDDAPDLSFSAVAVDPERDYVYLSAPKAIRVYGPAVVFPDANTGTGAALSPTSATLDGTVNLSGVPLTDCHFEYVTDADFLSGGFSSAESVPCDTNASAIPANFDEHAVSATVTGLDQATTYHFRISAANVNGTTIGAEALVPGPALVETVGSPIRTTSTAILQGRVYPRGAAATYQFEYGTSISYGQTTPAQPGGSGTQVRYVAQPISGLQANTTYHYRVVADNGTPGGSVVGDDRTFTTRSSDAPLTHGHFPGPPGSDRAWELVSNPDSAGNPVNLVTAFSDSGDRAIYSVNGALPGSQSGDARNQFFAQRTEAGPHAGSWQTDMSFYPKRGQLVGSAWRSSVGGPGDLSSYYAVNFDLATLDQQVWRLRPGGAPTLLPPGYNYEESLATVASEDGSRILNGVTQPLDPSYPSAGGFYDVTSGTPHLESLLPDGTPACRIRALDGEAFAHRVSHWLSDDGSRFFFSAAAAGDCSPEALAQVYLRDLDTHQTMRVSPAPISGPDCGGIFISSTEESAFFWSQSRLAADDAPPTACSNNAGRPVASNGAPGADVYRYDVSSGDLACVTCVAPRAEVEFNYIFQSAYIAVSQDGSRVYFNSPNRLLPSAAPGLYRVDVSSGDLAFIAPSSGTTARAGQSALDGQALSADGATLIFTSADPALDQLGGSTNGETRQYYLYDDNDRSLVCVSCPANGDAPKGPVPPRPINEVAATDQAGPNLTPVDAAGDFAFTTPTRLLSADQNTARPSQEPGVGADVYEWRDGRLLLVSDGATSWPDPGRPPTVGGFTPSGRDLFVLAPVKWTPDALDDFTRLYDARIGGGFEFPQPPPPCPLEACQGTPPPVPDASDPGSSTYGGPGNQARKGGAPPHRKHPKHRRKCKRSKTKKCKPARGANNHLGGSK